MNSSPIFIGGFFKSGTSLLRAMIGNHSRIASGLETQWFEIDWNSRSTVNGEPLDTCIDRLARFFDIPVDAVREMSLRASDVYAFITEVLGTYAKRQGKPRWAEKTPGNICHLPRIYEGWPDAKVIHIIRDPKDVFASLRETKKWDTPEVFANMWSNFLPRVIDARNAGLLNNGNYLEIRYESLVTQPETQARRILNFLDEPWEESVANFCGQAGDFEKVLQITGRESSTLARLSKPLGQDRVGIWRSIVSSAEVDSIRSLIQKAGHGEFLAQIENESVRLGF